MSRPLPRLLLLATAACLVAGAPAAPQESEPKRLGGLATEEAEEPGEEALPPGAIRVRAESYEQTRKGHLEARGLVDLRMADIRIQADQADVIEETQPDGSTRQRIVATGNVVFIRGEERLAGDRLEMDDAGKGTLTNAVGYLEPGVFVKARSIERLDADSYRVFGGTFTSCSQPNPRWGFSVSRARVDVDDKITGTNALFKVKGVPAFYTPFIYYPISKDHRSTGFLLPSIGYTEARGFNLRTGFFWAMGRSADQTLTFDYYSKAGYGLGHELRWVGRGSSRGTLRSVLFDLKGSTEHDYNVNWSLLQQLPGKVRATGNASLFSNRQFLQQYSDAYTNASQRTQRWSASLERDFGLAVLSLYSSSARTYYTSRSTVETSEGETEEQTSERLNVDERLPGFSLRRFPRQIGWGGLVFGLEGSAETIRYGTEDDDESCRETGNCRQVDTWTRYDIAPRLSRPLHVSFLDINPSFGYRYTRYGARVVVDKKGREVYDEQGQLIRDGPPLERSFFETSINLTGPTFARVFDTPGLGYSERFKHTIGPEVTWTYRTRVDDYGAIPKAGGQDYFLGTNQLDYALSQRFYAKRRGASGKLAPYEFLSWRLMQTYYVQIKEGQGNFDPNYSSSSYGPGGSVEHLSPIQSRVNLRPTPDLSLAYKLEYDVNYKQVRTMGANLSVTRPGFGLQANWSRTIRLNEDPTQRGVGSEWLSGSTGFELVPGRLRLEGSARYDLVTKRLWEMHAQARYGIQCCGFSVAVDRLYWNGRFDTGWHFNIELANVGSVGTSTGTEMMGGRSGLGGF